MVFASIKLYAGIALAVLVFLCFCYGAFLFIQNKNLKVTVNDLQDSIDAYALQVADLRESVARKEGAMLAYQNAAQQIQKVSDNAIERIRKYKGNGTDADKCLDLVAPRMHSNDSEGSAK